MSSFVSQNRRKEDNYRMDSQLKCLYSVVCLRCLRPNHRLISSKLRLVLFLLFLTLIAIFFVRTLSANKFNTNIFIANHFDDNLDQLRQELNYAVMIDAGSSGSRVHIYVWPPHTGDTRQLLQIRTLHNSLGKDVFYHINPGLSSCAANPSTASQYIAPLLRFAINNIPQEKHKTTPLFILATAGMRLLPQQTQNAILDDLRTDIPKNFSFLFPSNHVEVITGKEEGIYSWIALNYLMGRLDHSIERGPMTTVEANKHKIRRSQSIGMLEMGGASVQIAYEITTDGELERLKAKHSKESLNGLITEFNLGCSEHDSEHNYRLYVTTYLGLGANVARSSYVNSLISHTMNTHTDNTTLSAKQIQIYDPCLNIDSTQSFNISRRSKNINGSTSFIYWLKGSGDFNECNHRLSAMLDPKAESSRDCYIKPNTSCPLTQLKETEAPFDYSEFYGFSELWYTMEDVLRQGGLYQYSKFTESVSNWCSTSFSVIKDRFNRKLYPNADTDRLVNQCFKSAWISSVLHDGFKMPKSYNKYRTATTVNHQPVQWTLGALLYRTRYFPLRDIEQQYPVVSYSAVNSTTTSYYINYCLFIFCMFSVVICIAIYLRHLHQMVNKSHIYSNHFNTNLNEVKTRNDIMLDINTDTDPLIDAIR